MVSCRRFFAKLEAPNSQGTFLQRVLEQFSDRFCQCNPGMSVGETNTNTTINTNTIIDTNSTTHFHIADSVYVMCFSLILLSVDLSSPHVKNKMSKREFIRNTRGAVGAEGKREMQLIYPV